MDKTAHHPGKTLFMVVFFSALLGIPILVFQAKERREGNRSMSPDGTEAYFMEGATGARAHWASFPEAYAKITNEACEGLDSIEAFGLKLYVEKTVIHHLDGRQYRVECSRDGMPGLLSIEHQEEQLLFRWRQTGVLEYRKHFPIAAKQFRNVQEKMFNGEFYRPDGSLASRIQEGNGILTTFHENGNCWVKAEYENATLVEYSECRKDGSMIVHHDRDTFEPGSPH